MTAFKQTTTQPIQHTAHGIPKFLMMVQQKYKQLFLVPKATNDKLGKTYPQKDVYII